MFVRLWIYSMCALVVLGLFLFEPAFNWGGTQGLSLYTQAVNQSGVGMMFRAFVPAIIVFIGLLAYFGLGSAKK